MPDPIPTFQTSIIPSNSRIIVGLSGGPDSIYLLHQLHQCTSNLNIKLIAAHLDHEWQESSKLAVEVCKQICNDLQIPLIVKTITDLNFSFF